MLQIIKIEAFKYIKNPFGIIFGFGFPIMWTLIFGFVWGKETYFNQTTGQNTLLMNILFPPLSIMAILSFSVSSVSITMCSNRIEKRNKLISLARVTKYQYILSLAFTYFLLYFFVFLICIIIAISAFNLATSALW
ncbi:hypothetical protein [Spiroplasma turonicum]|uniref:ABC transporter permease n=1 Tax=Spiroplasma turonicum TaxID=216946 RepID=A0A0K1P8F1_9MOLU|nr:hypothetical protein [Spiroplasma turonicum]AKU80177.1 hypothetical protein STURON_00931 [Spiroplasma turonicum]ALX71177.1 hypothetical protein STURO_v1c09260 [Spiroplasma turonicum]